MRLVQVRFLATLRAALRDLYIDYEDDPGGYGHLRFDLRANLSGCVSGRGPEPWA